MTVHHTCELYCGKILSSHHHTVMLYKLLNVISVLCLLPLLIHIAGETSYIVSNSLIINQLVVIYCYCYLIIM